jgi:hypothetical protein
MWGSTCIPRKVYQVLYPLKRHFRCTQGQHFLVFCWLLMALIRDPGKGTLKGLTPYLPPTLKYWTTVRMVRSAQWDTEAVVCQMATATLCALPPPADGVLYLIGDSTLKEKRAGSIPWAARRAIASMIRTPLGLSWCCCSPVGAVFVSRSPWH